MANSKAERVDAMIRRAVREALGDYALRYPAEAEFISAKAGILGMEAAWKISADPYRMKELADIMAWKPAPKSR